jgi:two-component system, sensor histidine kinase YesM
LNVRFSGDINFERLINESILDTQIPAMVLQPIVENAVNYGIRGLNRKGVIKLSVFRGDTDICLSVKDNGIGMEKDKIAQVLAGQRLEDELTHNSNGVGLVNVISRLKLYFNREDVLEIISEGKDRGTEVVIHIPL